MVVIGPGPGPKNVLAERSDGFRLVVPYSVWKRKMLGVIRGGVYSSQETTNREVLMDAQVQIMQVTVRNTSTGKQVYDVACSDGKKRQVWEGNLAQQLNTFAGTGQFVTIRYTSKQNGQYVNESIQAFAPPGGQLPPDTAPQQLGGQPMQPQALPQALPQAVPLGGNTQPIQQAPVDSGGGGRFTPETTKRITKLAAYDYASAVVGGLFAGSGPEAEQQAVEMLDRIALHVYKAARSHEQQALPAGTITTPQGVADFANAQQPGVVQIGTPVAVAQDAAAEAPDVIDWN